VIEEGRRLGVRDLKTGPGGNGPQLLTPLASCSIGSPWCRLGSFTATATSACWRGRPLRGKLAGEAEGLQLADLRLMRSRIADIPGNVRI